MGIIIPILKTGKLSLRGLGNLHKMIQLTSDVCISPTSNVRYFFYKKVLPGKRGPSCLHQFFVLYPFTVTKGMCSAVAVSWCILPTWFGHASGDEEPCAPPPPSLYWSFLSIKRVSPAVYFPGDSQADSWKISPIPLLEAVVWNECGRP